MGRSPFCDEIGLKKGPWTPEEDQKLINHIKKHGHGSWRALPKLAGKYNFITQTLQKHCRLTCIGSFSNALFLKSLTHIR